MRMRLGWMAVAAIAVVAACSSDTGPGDGGGATGVTVGNFFFRSARNNTVNPAIDTVAVGSALTWTWTNTGETPHSVESENPPTFTSSDVQTGNGKTHTVTFTAPGTYEYDCAVHGSRMTGRVVVQ